MRLFKKIKIILIVMILFNHNVHASTCDSVSQLLMEQTWREFRAIHPFGFQTVALKHYGDTCVFVISEPANWVKAEELGNLFTQYNGLFTIEEQPFGYDGHLYDAIGCIKLDSDVFPIFEKNLFEFLYGTAYKPYYTNMDTPSQHVYYSKKNLNYEIPLLTWLGDGWMQEIFENSFQQIHSFGNLIKKQDSNELFYSKKRGFIVWEINPNQLDNNFRKNARRFALDSDLILAIFCKKNIFIVGREREIPVTILPPLRSESIRLLASLDSMDFNANIFSVFAHDSIEDSIWATKISMSEKIKNTELGNLLIISDLLLLSLNDSLSIKEYFIDYPLPSYQKNKNIIAPQLYSVYQILSWYLPDIIKDIPRNLTSLFQRNNKSANPCDNCMTDSDTYTLITQEKTGCLQPSIISDKKVDQILYNYFASLNNVDLLRIAQYAMIYRAFQFFNRKGETFDSSQITNNAPKDSWVRTPSAMVLNKKTDSVYYYGGKEYSFSKNF